MHMFVETSAGNDELSGVVVQMTMFRNILLVISCSLRFKDEDSLVHILQEIKEDYVIRLVRHSRCVALPDNHVPSRALIFQN